MVALFVSKALTKAHFVMTFTKSVNIFAALYYANLPVRRCN
jgi:hypothetical protein